MTDKSRNNKRNTNNNHDDDNNSGVSLTSLKNYDGLFAIRTKLLAAD